MIGWVGRDGDAYIRVAGFAQQGCIKDAGIGGKDEIDTVQRLAFRDQRPWAACCPCEAGHGDGVRVGGAVGIQEPRVHDDLRGWPCHAGGARGPIQMRRGVEITGQDDGNTLARQRGKTLHQGLCFGHTGGGFVGEGVGDAGPIAQHFGAVGVRRQVRIGKADHLTGGDHGPDLHSVTIDARNGIGRVGGFRPFAQFRVKQGKSREDVAADIDKRIPRGRCNRAGFAIGFLQAHDIGIGGTNGGEGLIETDLIATIPDVERQHAQRDIFGKGQMGHQQSGKGDGQAHGNPPSGLGGYSGIMSQSYVRAQGAKGGFQQIVAGFTCIPCIQNGGVDAALQAQPVDQADQAEGERVGVDAVVTRNGQFLHGSHHISAVGGVLAAVFVP